MIQKMLLSCVVTTGMTGLAAAAPPPIYVPTWTGCYIGGHAGYGTTTSSSQYSPGLQPAEFGALQINQSFDNKGLAGGGQVGCQLQTGTFLWGLDGDWSSFSNSSTKNLFFSFTGTPSTSETVNQKVNYDSLWSVRGRFGGIFSDVYHLYVTAGIGGARASYNSSESSSFVGLTSYHFQNATNVTMNPTGIVLGAGAEWKLWPQFVIGAEYLHYALLSDTALPAAAGASIGGGPITEWTGPSPSDHVHTNNIDVLRFRASYLFNWGR
jgi:outer membrane immunogenic protein